MISANSVSIVTDEIWLCFVQVREYLLLFERRVCSDEFVNFWDELCPTCVSVLEYSERRDVNVHEVVAFVAWALINWEISTDYLVTYFQPKVASGDCHNYELTLNDISLSVSSMQVILSTLLLRTGAM